jgi:alanine dehydrogenase
MHETITVLEEAFKEQALGQVIAPLRSAIRVTKDDWIGIMPAYLSGLQAFSTKIVSVYNTNPSRNLPTIMGTIVLNDPETGETLSVMDGSFITAMRTGGLSGLAAKYLSRKDSQSVGIFGAGVQGRTHLMALKEVRNITTAKVYDPMVDRAKTYSREMSKKLQIPVEVSQSPSDTVKESDIIVTVSTSKEPLFDGRIIRPGTHVNAFGNSNPSERELDNETIRRSKITVDSREAALLEAGDLIMAIRDGVITTHHILADLGEIIIGSKPGRTSATDVTLFKSVGIGIQDCAAASLAYKKAVEKGVGTRVNLL